jgi:hypothetical protein
VGRGENWRRERPEWEEEKTGEQGRGNMPAWEWGELPRERRGEKEVGEEKWGEEEEREWGVRATCHPPVPNVVCTWTSPFGDVWQCATLANADVANCHVTLFKKKKP